MPFFFKSSMIGYVIQLQIQKKIFMENLEATVQSDLALGSMSQGSKSQMLQWSHTMYVLTIIQAKKKLKPCLQVKLSQCYSKLHYSIEISSHDRWCWTSQAWRRHWIPCCHTVVN